MTDRQDDSGPDCFDCSHAAAVRACGCGFCLALSRPAIAPQATPAAVDAKYAELIYAVASKYPGESRHETALRYIREREESPSIESCAALAAPPAEVKP